MWLCDSDLGIAMGAVLGTSLTKKAKKEKGDEP